MHLNVRITYRLHWCSLLGHFGQSGNQSNAVNGAHRFLNENACMAVFRPGDAVRCVRTHTSIEQIYLIRSWNLIRARYWVKLFHSEQKNAPYRIDKLVAWTWDESKASYSISILSQRCIHSACSSVKIISITSISIASDNSTAQIDGRTSK